MRSSRVERIYYGSPSNVGKARDHEETSGSQFKHPLMVKENWKVLAGRQKTHNNNILTLLNTANIAMLTKLPAVGPKSAFVIQQQHPHPAQHGQYRNADETSRCWPQVGLRYSTI